MLTATDKSDAVEELPHAATIADVAHAAGVACATASRALNGGRASTATAERVRRAAAELGYRPSYIGRMLSARRTENIAAVVTSLERNALVHALQGLQSQMAASGSSVTVIDLSAPRAGEAGGALLLYDRDRFDGVAILGSAGRAEVENVAQSTPVASFGAMEISGAVDPVKLAVEHLRLLGHADVHYIGVDSERVDHADYDGSRTAGFARSARAGLGGTSIGFTDPTLDGGYVAAVGALATDERRPSAIIAGSAEIAVGVVLAAERLGLRVPHDLSVVGIEDHSLATMLGLTTVDVRSFERGRAIAHQLQGNAGIRDHESAIADEREVLPILRLRTSTAPVLDARDGPSAGARR